MPFAMNNRTIPYIYKGNDRNELSSFILTITTATQIMYIWDLEDFNITTNISCIPGTSRNSVSADLHTGSIVCDGSIYFRSTYY